MVLLCANSIMSCQPLNLRRTVATAPCIAPRIYPVCPLRTGVLALARSKTAKRRPSGLVTTAAAQQTAGAQELSVADYGSAFFVLSFIVAHVKNLTVNAPLLLKAMGAFAIYNALSAMLVGVSNNTDEAAVIAPAVLASAALGLNGGDFGTITIGLFSFFTTKSLGLPTLACMGVYATFFLAAYKGFAAEWLTGCIATKSAMSLFQVLLATLAVCGVLSTSHQPLAAQIASIFSLRALGQGERGTKAIMDVAVLAATAFVVYKGIYPLWVTVGGISAVTWSAVSHAASMVKA